MRPFTCSMKASTCPSATSKTSSSWTCITIQASISQASPCSQASTSIIARLMMSAAVPCMGALIAVRSAPWRRARFWEWISGRVRRRPNTVSTKPSSAAWARMRSM